MYAAALRVAAGEVLNAGAQNAAGLAAEARGDLPGAAAAFRRAAALCAAPRGERSKLKKTNNRKGAPAPVEHPALPPVPTDTHNASFLRWVL